MKKSILLLILIVFTGILRSQTGFPEKLTTPFAIKWSQDNKENNRPLDLNKINIFVFTSTAEDPNNEKSGIYKFFKDLDVLLDSNSKEVSTQTDIAPGKYKEYAPQINIYIIYVGNDYNTYKSSCSAALKILNIYKYSTNIVYLEDIKNSSLKDFEVKNITSCVAAVYDDEGKLCEKWNANTSEYLKFDKIYKKKIIPKTMIHGRLIHIVGGKKVPLTNTPISLLKPLSKKPISKINTDEKGNFSFELPDAIKGYSLTIETDSKDIKYIILTNQRGDEIKRIIKYKNGFTYNIIDADIPSLSQMEEEEVVLATPIKINGKILTDKEGTKIPLMNTTVSVISNKSNKVVNKATTDKYGDFTLNVAKDIGGYSLLIDPESKTVDNVIIADQHGKELKKLKRTAEGFRYKMIDSDINLFAEMPEEEDITLTFKKLTTEKKDLDISKSINYGFNETKFSKDAEPTLNEIATLLKENPTVNLEVISHTDSQGDDNSNLTLSRNRSNSVIEYLVSIGIDAKRLKAIGKGETSIRNRCTNGIDCSDREHEYNRRTEFHFQKTK